MVNMGRILGKLGKFLLISLNLIKSADESMIEILKMAYYERELQEHSKDSKIIEFEFDFVQKFKIEVRGYF